MILYRDWTITSDGLLARQYDNLSRRVEVVGDLPTGWSWELLVQVGDALDIIPLEPMEGGVGHTLTAEQVSIDGYYTVQLRGRNGEIIKHTNTTPVFVSKSLSGTERWPSIPSEFTELEQRMWELNNHPPKPGEDGYWMLWDTEQDEYVRSDIHLPDGTGGSDASVTKENIEAALGYTPADEKVVNRITEEIVNLGGFVEPAPDDIPKVFFTGNAPTNKAEDELPLTMEYISKTKRFFSYVTLKVQGDSSAGYPKKNFNLKMFSDEAREEKQKMQFRNWKAKTHKYCLKANWIDHTHARNVVGGRLWNQIVKTRADYDSYPAEYRESSNSGAVDGFPIKVYLNGVYQGLYTWNIRKDDSMFNMDDSTGTQAALIADAGNAVTVWRSLPSIDGSDWTDELNDIVPDAVKTGFRAVYSFVMNSTDEEFKENIEQHFYLSSLIDYYIYIYSILMIGGLAKSQTMFTYDAAKYLANIYDMDTTWALSWSGTSFYDVHTPVPSGYTAETEVGKSNLLYERLAALFPDKIKARYIELRNSVLSDANIINEFERFMDVIPPDLYAEDYASTTANGAFTEIPSKATNTLQKLREVIVQRTAYCDANIPLIGDGSGDGDDTGDDNVSGVAWEIGGLDNNNVGNTNSARIHTVGYLPDNVTGLSVNSGYAYILVCTNSAGKVYDGNKGYYHPSTNRLWYDGEYSSNAINFADIASVLGDYNKIRVLLKRTDGATMSIEEGENVIFTTDVAM